MLGGALRATGCGSPLGGYDQQLRAAQKWLDTHEIEFWEGLNEDMGATAVWGSQQLGLFPGARRDGTGAARLRGW